MSDDKNTFTVDIRRVAAMQHTIDLLHYRLSVIKTLVLSDEMPDIVLPYDDSDDKDFNETVRRIKRMRRTAQWPE